MAAILVAWPAWNVGCSKPQSETRVGVQTGLPGLGWVP